MTYGRCAKGTPRNVVIHIVELFVHSKTAPTISLVFRSLLGLLEPISLVRNDVVVTEHLLET